ncbi:MAG TPA: hypothetical protein VEI01_17475 [Terriglobales bacterium]|nr:hypothetical protein [Terriglobales bacterium]
MPQIVGNVSAGITGHQLGLGVGGPVVDLIGYSDPNTLSDPSITSAAVGSTFRRLDGPNTTAVFYVRTAVDGGQPWTPK